MDRNAKLSPQSTGPVLVGEALSRALAEAAKSAQPLPSAFLNALAREVRP